MTRCTDPLTMVTDRGDLSFASSKQELDRMCPKLMDGLPCMNRGQVGTGTKVPEVLASNHNTRNCH